MGGRESFCVNNVSGRHITTLSARNVSKGSNNVGSRSNPDRGVRIGVGSLAFAVSSVTQWSQSDPCQSFFEGHARK